MDEIDTHFDEVRIERQKALRLHYNGSLRRHQSIIAKAKDEDKKTRDKVFPEEILFNKEEPIPTK